MNTFLAISALAVVSFRIKKRDSVIKELPNTLQPTRKDPLTTPEAEQHVHRLLKLNERFEVRYDGAEPSQPQYEGKNMALIQVYETNGNTMATYGWYYINMNYGDLYKYTIATNEITKIDDVNNLITYEEAK